MRGSVLVLGCAAATATWAQTPLSDIVAIEAGKWHACALTSAGQVKCWGDNLAGVVGVSPAGGTVSMAVTVPGIEGATAISAFENHTCALVAEGAMKCWGSNNQGQLGHADLQPRLFPTEPVPGLTGVVDIAVGGTFTCALTATSGVLYWGQDNVGQLGNGPPAQNSAIPVVVLALDVAVFGDGFEEL